MLKRQSMKTAVADLKNAATMRKQRTFNRELIEALAALEHEQWAHWSRAVSKEVGEETRQKWKRHWIPYAQLKEKWKEEDRVWARKVVGVLKRQKMIEV
jgi:hypothetical protein